MPKLRTYQTNFSGGLLSRGMRSRVDLGQYQNGCSTMDNWWPNISGGLERRPGSKFLYETPSIRRVEPFIFNEEQTYFVVWTDFNMKVIQTDGTSLTTLAWTYDTSYIPELSVAQLGDVMFITHPSIGLKKLTRTSATTFTLTDYAFEGSGPSSTDYPFFMPFFKFANPGVTLACSGYTGSVAVTASEAIFSADYVGRILRYRGKQMVVTSYTTPQIVQCLVKEELDQSVVISFNTGNPNDYINGEIAVGRDSGAKMEIIYTSFGGQYGTAGVAMIAGTIEDGNILQPGEEIEGLDSGNICQVIGTLSTAPLAHPDWDEEAFSDQRGWPSIVLFHAQRLWLGGSSSLPAHIFGSKVAAFFNFDTGEALPNESIQVALVDNQIGSIVNMVGGRHLQIFTDAAEYYVPQYEDQPLTPDTFDVRVQTRYGCKSDVRAKVFDETTLFVQGRGSALREFSYQSSVRGYISEAVSILVDEYLATIVDLDVLYGGYDRPEQIAFCVTSDGHILWYHSSKSEQIRQWGRWTTNGTYTNVCVVADKLYAVVDRDGLTTIEEFSFDYTVDAGIPLTNGSPTKSWTITHPHDFPFFESAEVAAVSGVVAGEADYYLGQLTTDPSGNFATPVAVDNVVVGFNFTQTVEPMPIEVQDPRGISGGMPKRLVSINAFVESTLALKVDGTRISVFQAHQDWTQKPAVQFGPQKFYLLGYDEQPTVSLVNDVPLKCEVLGLATEVEY